MPRIPDARQWRDRQFPAQRARRGGPHPRLARSAACRRRRPRPRRRRDRQVDRPGRRGDALRQRLLARFPRPSHRPPQDDAAPAMPRLRAGGPPSSRPRADAAASPVEPGSRPQQRRPALGAAGGDGAQIPPSDRPRQRRRDRTGARRRRGRPVAPCLVGGQQSRPEERQRACVAQQFAVQEFGQGRHARTGRGERAVRGGRALFRSLPRRRDPPPRPLRGFFRRRGHPPQRRPEFQRPAIRMRRRDQRPADAVQLRPATLRPRRRDRLVAGVVPDGRALPMAADVDAVLLRAARRQTRLLPAGLERLRVRQHAGGGYPPGLFRTGRTRRLRLLVV